MRYRRKQWLGPSPHCEQVFTWWRGRPTIEGNTARGASSPANPALTRPEPLSHTRAVVSSSSHMSALQHTTTRASVWVVVVHGGWFWYYVQTYCASNELAFDICFDESLTWSVPRLVWLQLHPGYKTDDVFIFLHLHGNIWLVRNVRC